MFGESVFDDDDILDSLPPIKGKNAARYSNISPDITKLYSEANREWFRLQAISDLLPRLHKGLSTIIAYESRLVKGEEVKVNTADLISLLGGTPYTLRKQFKRFHSQVAHWKVWLWKDVRSFVIARFTKSVFHEYLAALE